VCDCAGLQLEHQQLRSLNPAQDGALIYRADMQSTLHEVVLYGFLQPNAAGYMHVSPSWGMLVLVCADLGGALIQHACFQ
jgi:hypothetical protein